MVREDGEGQGSTHANGRYCDIKGEGFGRKEIRCDYKALHLEFDDGFNDTQHKIFLLLSLPKYFIISAILK